MQSMYGRLVLFIVIMASIGGCANYGSTKGTVEMAQVAITEQADGNRYPGKFIWHDLLTSDVHAAGEFYSKLFGWDIEYHNQYAIARNNGKLVAGILQMKPKETSENAGFWIPSVSVEEVEPALKILLGNGGVVVNGPADMEQRGRAALVKDSDGAYLVLLKTRQGDPADTDAAIGDWLWDELWSKNPERSEAFYTALLGYDEIASGDGYGIFIRDGKWRAGMRYVEDESQPPMWVPVIRVADPQAIVDKVVNLGGVVWIAPEDAPNKGETALISDSVGAMLLIQRWPTHTSKGGQ